MKIKSLLILNMLVASPYRSTAAEDILKGKAKDASGRLVYEETHHIERHKDGTAVKINTSYTTPSGEVFAIFKSDFSKGPFLPESQFEDHRFQRKIIGRFVSLEANKWNYEVHEEKGGKEIKTTQLHLSPDSISGQGFDNFILTHFLKGSESDKVIPFVVLPRHDFFHFRVLKNQMKAQEDTVFQIRPTNFLIRAFVDPIELTYDSETKQLKRYKGLSNLPSVDDQPQSVVIEYESLKKAGI